MIVRDLDKLGRVTLPIELRRMLGMEVCSPVDISLDGEKVIIQKYSPNKPGKCCICGADNTKEKIVNYKNITICEKCLAELRKSV